MLQHVWPIWLIWVTHTHTHTYARVRERAHHDDIIHSLFIILTYIISTTLILSHCNIVSETQLFEISARHATIKRVYTESIKRVH